MFFYSPIQLDEFKGRCKALKLLSDEKETVTVQYHLAILFTYLYLYLIY